MVAPIDVRIVGNADGLNATLHEAGREVDVFGGKVGVQLPPKMALAVDATKFVAKGIVNVGKAGKDAAAEEQIFADAMAKLGISSDESAAKMDDAITASQKLAFTDTETRKALLSLATATGDADTAIQLLSTAQDVARVSGGTLEQSSDAVAKAFNGQDTQLKRMLPGLADGATSMDTIKNASDLAAGAADTYGKSSAAAGKKAQIAFGELKETVGGELSPALHELGAALRPLIKQLIEIAAVVLPPVLKLLSKMIEIAAKVAGAIGKITDAVGRLMDKLRALIEPIQKVIDKLGQIDLNPFNRAQGIIGGQTVQVAAASTRDATATPAVGTKTGGGVTVNIYGDPSVIEARVTSALRAYARRNGVTAVFSPDRN